MKTSPQPKGPWIHRFSIRIFTVVLAILVYWVLGFLVEDIKSIKGPQYDEIERKHVDQTLVERDKNLVADIAELDRAISNKREEIRIVGDSSRNLQETITQMIELQKLSVQKSITLPEAEQTNLSESLSRFLEYQRRYQEYNAELSALTDRKQSLESERLIVKRKIEQQQKPARDEYQRLAEKHRLRLAAFQLMILIPLLAVGVFLTVKKRGSIYFPLFLGYGAAVLLKVSLVVHAYFPSRYFKSQVSHPYWGVLGVKSQ